MARIADARPGARFGQLTVVGEVSRGRGARVQVRCDCGTEKSVRVANLGRTVTSCGCLRAKLSADRKTTHGLSKRPEYNVWCLMIRRCTRPNVPEWKNYGGRGIKVCDQWRNDFTSFFRHMGPRPTPKHELDRIDNDGHYEPGNVRWATKEQQNANRRRRLVCKLGHRIEGENEVQTSSGRRCGKCYREYLRRNAERRRARAAAVRQTPDN